MPKKIKLDLARVEKAKGVLSKLLEPTPLLFNPWLSELLQCKLYLKLESMQPIGSFKIRGATFKISELSSAERKRGVVAVSAGNHAQGVAWGSARFNTKATIVMPKNASLIKIENTAALGAKVLLEGNSYDEAFEYAARLVKKTKQTLVHPYNDPDVIAGQGTIGFEILDQLHDVDVVIGALGGGGLMSGVGSVIKSLKPSTAIVGAQASGSRSLVESIKAKKIIKLDKADTFADGIKVKNAAPQMLSYLLPVIDEVSHADDEAIAASVLMLMEKAKIVAEGAAALSLAVAYQLKEKLKNKKVVLVIGGGNIDVNLLGRIIDRGLIQSGRRVRLDVSIEDRPGALNRLTESIARSGGNILQAIHDRDSPRAALNQTLVELTVETKGKAHSKSLINDLTKQKFVVDVLHET